MGIAITLGTSIVGGGSPNDILTALGATFAIDAGRSVADEQVAVNFGSGGAALNATYGSTGGVDTNDPLLLTHAGTNYLYCPGGSTVPATIPHNVNHVATGDVEFVARIRVDSLAISMNLSSRGFSNNVGGFQVYASSSGNLGVGLVFGGVTTYRTGSVFIGTTVALGTWFWARITRVASSGLVSFFYADDQLNEPSSWTAVGTGSTTAGACADTSNQLTVGASITGGEPLSGGVSRAIWRNAGTTFVDANFSTNTNQTSFTESSSNASTVTINRATSGRKAAMVTRPTWLFGTDDYLEVADNALIDFALADSFTVVAVVRNWATFGTNDAIVAKKANTTNTTTGWALTNHGTTAEQLAADVGDGAAGAEATSASRTSGALTVVSMVRNVGSDNITTYVNSTAGTPVTDATTATSANAEVMRIGRLSGAGTEYNDMEVVAVAVFPSALSAADIAAIVAYYGV